MGEAKRRKKLDPIFGKLPKSLPGFAPDFGLYLSKPDEDSSSLLIEVDWEFPFFVYDHNTKILRLNAFVYFDRESFCATFEFPNTKTELANGLKRLPITGLSGHVYAAKSRQYRDGNNQRVIPLLPVNIEELRFFVKSESGSFFHIQDGKIGPANWFPGGS